MSIPAETQRMLADSDPEFRQWAEEHHHCEARLNELVSKGEISMAEEVEEKTLKKTKLRLKDQMTERLRTWESSRASS